VASGTGVDVPAEETGVDFPFEELAGVGVGDDARFFWQI
jgi:hypothetical protein